MRDLLSYLNRRTLHLQMINCDEKLFTGRTAQVSYVGIREWNDKGRNAMNNKLSNAGTR